MKGRHLKVTKREKNSQLVSWTYETTKDWLLNRNEKIFSLYIISHRWLSYLEISLHRITVCRLLVYFIPISENLT